jgi:hypothetical protein
MTTEILFLLFLLFVKHWYVDFVNQSMDEVNSKGIYGNPLGVWHSVKHGIGTFIVFWFTDVILIAAIFLACLDAVIHYHVDWLKMNKGNRDIHSPKFWQHLGLDQLAHYTTYLFLVWLVA